MRLQPGGGSKPPGAPVEPVPLYRRAEAAPTDCRNSARASGPCQRLARPEGLGFWFTARDPGFAWGTHLVDPDARTNTSHDRSARAGLSSAGSATNQMVATASPMTRTRSGSTLLGSLERSFATATPGRPCACLAADTSVGSAGAGVDSCPVRVRRTARRLDVAAGRVTRHRGGWPASRAVTLPDRGRTTGAFAPTPNQDRKLEDECIAHRDPATVIHRERFSRIRRERSRSGAVLRSPVVGSGRARPAGLDRGAAAGRAPVSAARAKAEVESRLA